MLQAPPAQGQQISLPPPLLDRHPFEIHRRRIRHPRQAHLRADLKTSKQCYSERCIRIRRGFNTGRTCWRRSGHFHNLVHAAAFASAVLLYTLPCIKARTSCRRYRTRRPIFTKGRWEPSNRHEARVFIGMPV